jgi:hypothetical protein
MTLDLFDKGPAVLSGQQPARHRHARKATRPGHPRPRDAVKPETRTSAREAAIAALRKMADAVAIRVNGAHTEWHGPDVVAVMHDKPDAVVRAARRSQGRTGFVRNQTGLPVWR